MKPPWAGSMKTPVMPDSSKRLEQRLFVRGPFVGVAGPCGDQAGYRSARHGADGLHQHLQVVAVGEAPQDLPDIVAGQGA